MTKKKPARPKRVLNPLVWHRSKTEQSKKKVDDKRACRGPVREDDK